MASSIRKRLTFANVTSLLALMVALGGSAVAAGMIGGKRIINESVTGADVRDGSLHASEIDANAVGSSEVAAGSVGGSEVSDGSLTGADVASGSIPPGDLSGVTPPGGTLPTGVTLRGVFSPHGFASTVVAVTHGVSFGGYTLPAAPTVRFVGVDFIPTTTCPGSFSQPEATAGNLCIYINKVTSSAAQVLVQDPTAPFGVLRGANYNMNTGVTTAYPGGQTVSKWGFKITYSQDAAGAQADLQGTWAVTT